MINLALRSEYSFGQVYGRVSVGADKKKIDDNITSILDHIGDEKHSGIADLHNTFGHVPFTNECKIRKVSPIYGVRLFVYEEAKTSKVKFGAPYIFLARNDDGLKELYKLITLSYSQFYYFPRVDIEDISGLSKNVIIIANNPVADSRVDYFAVEPSTSRMIYDKTDLPKVAINTNYFSTPQERSTYEIVCGRNQTKQTYAQHILSDDEFMRLWDDQDALDNTHKIAEQCTAKLSSAPMLKYNGKLNFEKEIKFGIKHRKLKMTKEVKKRLKYEIKLIKEKEYVDYFMVVADILKYAKRNNILIGHARGSSAGSLVCYLLEITEVNPLQHGLLFERFIDVNRFDLPDIDIDFPDKKRRQIINKLIKDYGKDNVGHIANVIRFRILSAISHTAKVLHIPVDETNVMKNSLSIIKGGDARLHNDFLDMFESEQGKIYIEKYPGMKFARYLDHHASTIGKHAAGIIISNEPIYHYAPRDLKHDVIMGTKKDMVELNLLKIDCLGLKTLSVIEGVMEQIGWGVQDVYNIPIEDKKTFKIFNKMRIAGVFQFEGRALQYVARKIGVHNFEDIVAITALARPGALQSGGTQRYISVYLGNQEPEYYGSKMYKKILEATNGVLIYQEQMMLIAKDIGCMSWAEIAELRAGASKTKGKDYFDNFKKSFMDGAKKNKKERISNENLEKIWHSVSYCGSWVFNKSHAVSYAYISYICAYLKGHYPLEFAIANLNNEHNEDAARRFLRDIVTNEKIKYVPVDAIVSTDCWTIHGKKIYGSLQTINGIGVITAREIIRRRTNGLAYTPSVASKLKTPETPFQNIFPAEKKFKKLYLQKQLSYIIDINAEGTYSAAGFIFRKDIRDRNDLQAVTKRGGTYVDKNQFYSTFIIEDDTDQIMCMISPQDFERMNGRAFIESLITGTSWVVVHGVWRGDWRMLTLKSFELIAEGE